MTITGKLYTIFCTEDDTFYIGSTIQRLSNRMSGHRQHARERRCDSLLYNHMNSVGIDKFYISLISVKEYPSREALVAREFQLIQKYKAIDPENCLNTEDDLGKRSPAMITKMSASMKQTRNGADFLATICKYVYTITFGDGSSAQTDNLGRYAKSNGYDTGHIFKVLSGQYRYHKNIVKVERVAKQ